MKIRREVKAYIEAELRDYQLTRKELEELKEDIRHETSDKDDGGGKSSAISNPTEQRVIKLVTNKRIRRMEQVVNAIEVVTQELPQEKLKLVQLKYWTRPRRLTDAGIAAQLSCNSRTVHKWTNGICLAIAGELGLIK